MKRSIIIWSIILAILAIGLYFYSSKAEAPKPKTDFEIRMEKWNQIGELKIKAEEKRAEAKKSTTEAEEIETKKNDLLQEFNGLGLSQ